MWRRDFEAGEFEARRDTAADERPSSKTHRALPVMRRNNTLRALPRGEIGAKPVHACLTAVA